MNENVEASKLEDMRKSIVVSSRVRLARNLEDYNFPNKLETNEAKDIISKVKKSLDGYDINFGTRDNLIINSKQNTNVYFTKIDNNTINYITNDYMEVLRLMNYLM